MSLEDEVNFSLKLLSLLDAANSSTVFSPASILNSLAMIHSGAKGKTAEEIASIIGKVNLSGMLGRPTKVEKAIHKAVIKIDEKGTEASAATGSVMVARCGPSLFCATHPFLYYITSDEGNDSTKPKDIPFMGTFC